MICARLYLRVGLPFFCSVIPCLLYINSRILKSRPLKQIYTRELLDSFIYMYILKHKRNCWGNLLCHRPLVSPTDLLVWPIFFIAGALKLETWVKVLQISMLCLRLRLLKLWSLRFFHEDFKFDIGWFLF